MSLDGITRRMIRLALEEDIGPGDLTSQLIKDTAIGTAAMVTRQPVVVSGELAVTEVYRQLDPEVSITWLTADGTQAPPGTALGRIHGPARSILTGERLALNLLQRMCAIATFTKAAVDQIADTSAKIVDTRKTTPGLRALEKAAVRAGGGTNHRFGLFDGIMIKDNHIAAAGSLTEAVRLAKSIAHHLLKIEVEVDTLTQLDEALDAGADVILLDNMDDETLRKAVIKTQGRALLEASGGITLDRLSSVARTGVDVISLGALTHTVKAADIGLDWNTP